MIKVFCDKCGEDVTQDNFVVDFATNTPMRTIGEIDGEELHLCRPCFKLVLEFITGEKEGSQ